MDCQESRKADCTAVARIIYDECHARGVKLSPFKNYRDKGLTLNEIKSCVQALGWNAIIHEGSNKYVYKPNPELSN